MSLLLLDVDREVIRDVVRYGTISDRIVTDATRTVDRTKPDAFEKRLGERKWVGDKRPDKLRNDFAAHLRPLLISGAHHVDNNAL